MKNQPPNPRDGDMNEIPHSRPAGYGRGDHEHDEDELPGWLVSCLFGFIAVAVLTLIWAVILPMLTGK